MGLKEYTEKMREYMKAGEDPAACHQMWVLNSRSAARVHDFDVRLIPSPVLQPVLDEAAEMLRRWRQGAHGHQTRPPRPNYRGRWPASA